MKEFILGSSLMNIGETKISDLQTSDSSRQISWYSATNMVVTEVSVFTKKKTTKLISLNKEAPVILQAFNTTANHTNSDKPKSLLHWNSVRSKMRKKWNITKLERHNSKVQFLEFHNRKGNSHLYHWRKEPQVST